MTYPQELFRRAAKVLINKTRILLCSLLLAGCEGNNDPSQIQVFAASSLIEVGTAWKKDFESQHPSARIIYQFQGSQQLALQIAEGAQPDIFLSAASAPMQRLVEGNVVDEMSVFPLCMNRLLVISSTQLTPIMDDWRELMRPGLKLVIGVNEVPVGQATLHMFKAAGTEFETKALANVVSYEPNVKAVLSRVRLGEADAGVVYQTDVRREDATLIRSHELPVEINPPTTYFGVLLPQAAKREAVQSFLAYVRGEGGQKILINHSFGVIHGHEIPKTEILNLKP